MENVYEEIVEEWKARDPYLQDIEGFEKFLEDKLGEKYSDKFFEFRCDAKKLKNVLEIIKEVGEIKLICSDKYVRLYGLDASYVWLVDLYLYPPFFTVLEGAGSIDLDVKELYQCLKNFKKPVDVTVRGYLDKLKILFDDVGVELDVRDEREVKEFYMEYPFGVKAEVNIHKIYDFIKFIDKKYEHVKFVSKDGVLKMVCENDTKSASCFLTECLAEEEVMIGLEYLTPIVKGLCKCLDEVTIECKTEKPLIIRGDGDYWHIDVYIAPRIEGEG